MKISREDKELFLYAVYMSLVKMLCPVHEELQNGNSKLHVARMKFIYLPEDTKGLLLEQADAAVSKMLSFESFFPDDGVYGILFQPAKNIRRVYDMPDDCAYDLVILMESGRRICICCAAEPVAFRYFHPFACTPEVSAVSFPGSRRLSSSFRVYQSRMEKPCRFLTEHLREKWGRYDRKALIFEPCQEAMAEFVEEACKEDYLFPTAFLSYYFGELDYYLLFPAFDAAGLGIYNPNGVLYQMGREKAGSMSLPARLLDARVKRDRLSSKGGTVSSYFFDNGIVVELWISTMSTSIDPSAVYFKAKMKYTPPGMVYEQIPL